MVSCLTIVSNNFLCQIGNVAWLLEEGTEDDFYDFLELYIRRWRGKAFSIKTGCNTNGRRAAEKGGVRGSEPRSLDDLLIPRDEDMEDEEQDLEDSRRSLSVIPVDEVENPTQLDPMHNITRDYFDRAGGNWFLFHPYDWYVRGVDVYAVG